MQWATHSAVRSRRPPWLLSALLLGLLATPLAAQHRYQLKYTPGSQEGGILELIGHQLDTNRKIEETERFLKLFPNHAATDYLHEWLMFTYRRAKQLDQALANGEKLLARHPDDFDTLYRCWQMAEEKKDTKLVESYYGKTLALAAKVVAAKAGPADVDAQVWKETVSVAKGMLEQEEYARFAKAVEASDPFDKIQMLEAFLKAYPKSKYAERIWPHLLSASRAAGDPVKTLQMAEKLLTMDPNDLDSLLLSAQIMLERKISYTKVIANANRVLQVLATKAKPEGQTAADWEKRKAYYVGSANLLLGNASVNTNSFASADRFLRVALPYFKGAEQSQAGILFYLGWSNYHLENYKEAAGFFRACMAIGGPFREQALQNLSALKSERRITE